MLPFTSSPTCNPPPGAASSPSEGGLCYLHSSVLPQPSSALGLCRPNWLSAPNPLATDRSFNIQAYVPLNFLVFPLFIGVNFLLYGLLHDGLLFHLPFAHQAQPHGHFFSSLWAFVSLCPLLGTLTPSSWHGSNFSLFGSKKFLLVVTQVASHSYLSAFTFFDMLVTI